MILNPTAWFGKACSLSVCPNQCGAGADWGVCRWQDHNRHPRKSTSHTILTRFPDPLLETSGSGNLADTNLVTNVYYQNHQDHLQEGWRIRVEAWVSVQSRICRRRLFSQWTGPLTLIVKIDMLVVLWNWELSCVPNVYNHLIRLKIWKTCHVFLIINLTKTKLFQNFWNKMKL